MDIRQLRYLSSAARSGSLTHAAKEHHVSVQAVSKGVADLEREVGTPLLTRDNRGVRPTALGRAFLERTRDVLEGFSALQAFVANTPGAMRDVVAGDAAGRLLVAFCAPAFTNAERIMQKLSRFLSHATGVRLELFVSPLDDALAALDAGAVDAVITIGTHRSAQTTCTVIGSLPTGIAVRDDHPLTRQRAVALADLAPYPVIWAEPFDGARESVLARYLAQGLASPVIHVDAPAVGAGGRTSRDVDEGERARAYSMMVYLPALKRPFPGCRALPIATPDQIPVPICLVAKTDAPGPRAHRVYRAHPQGARVLQQKRRIRRGGARHGARRRARRSRWLACPPPPSRTRPHPYRPPRSARADRNERPCPLPCPLQQTPQQAAPLRATPALRRTPHRRAPQPPMAVRPPGGATHGGAASSCCFSSSHSSPQRRSRSPFSTVRSRSAWASAR